MNSKTTRFISLALLLIVVLALVACGQEPAPAPTPAPAPAPAPAPVERIILHATTQHPPHNANILAFERFTQKVHAAAGDELLIITHFGAELVSAADQFDAVARGTVDMCGQDVSSYHSGEVPAWQIDWIPFAQDFDNFTNVRNAVMPIVNEKVLAEHNTMALSWQGQALMLLWTIDPIKTLEDAKGKKIRGGGGLFSQTVNNLGASDVSMSASEVYTALQNGVIDGAYWSLASVRGYKAYEILHYATLPSLAPGSNWATINLKRFKSLPLHLQKLMIDMGNEGDIETQEKYAKPSIKEGLNFLHDQGYTFTYLSEEELAKWKEAESGCRQWYLDQAGPVGPELLAALDKYPYTGQFEKTVYDAWK